MPRVCVLLLDSLGIGASLDATSYGDTGANTLGHIAQYCAEGKANNAVRQGPLYLPNLCRRGLQNAVLASSGIHLAGSSVIAKPESHWGYAVEKSAGKDTPSGHWEIAGVPVLTPWGYFSNAVPCFPKKLIQAFIQKANITGVLGNKHASGTDILVECGEEHIRTLNPIVYTSADSVFQIAAHEQYFGLERLCEICEIARELVNPYNIGRVIARPFIGEVGSFKRTGNRHDYSVQPPDDTLFDCLKANGKDVIAIGKTADIFAHRGITQTIKADGNMALFDATLAALKNNVQDCLIFTNFVDFDSSYGHRRDPAGYAMALEAFDRRLPELDALLQLDDCVVLTADHGCDPTFPGSDHTREHIPAICYGPKIASHFIGRRETFADIGQSLAQWMQITPLKEGISFL
jgi:phosphopentomutase